MTRMRINPGKPIFESMLSSPNEKDMSIIANNPVKMNR
jgi:hypothetical protein